MNKNIFSDKKWTEYWDDLMTKSADPVEWGTIVHEKPKHKNLTTEEEAKVHKTRRKFKVKYKK